MTRGEVPKPQRLHRGGSTTSNFSPLAHIHCWISLLGKGSIVSRPGDSNPIRIPRRRAAKGGGMPATLLWVCITGRGWHGSGHSECFSAYDHVQDDVVTAVYHLHPQLIDNSATDKASMFVCQQCYKYLCKRRSMQPRASKWATGTKMNDSTSSFKCDSKHVFN